MQLACEEGHLKVVKTLLDHGADVSICNSNGLNALDIAIENGQKYIISCYSLYDNMFNV